MPRSGDRAAEEFQPVGSPLVPARTGRCHPILHCHPSLASPPCLPCRLRHCCLVSHRWHSAVHTAPLLLPLRTRLANSSAQAQSFAAWLRKHGSRLAILSLEIGSPGIAANQLQPELPPLFHALASSATRLERLQLSFSKVAPAALRVPPSLKRLLVSVYPNELGVLPDGWLSDLSGLEALHLSGRCNTTQAEQVRQSGQGWGWCQVCKMRPWNHAAPEYPWLECSRVHHAQLTHHAAGEPASPGIPGPDWLRICGAPICGLDQARPSGFSGWRHPPAGPAVFGAAQCQPAGLPSGAVSPGSADHRQPPARPGCAH